MEFAPRREVSLANSSPAPLAVLHGPVGLRTDVRDGRRNRPRTAHQRVGSIHAVALRCLPRLSVSPQRQTQLVTKSRLNNTGSKSFLEKITRLPNQVSLFLCEIITTKGFHFFQRFDQLKLLVSLR